MNNPDFITAVAYEEDGEYWISMTRSEINGLGGGLYSSRYNTIFDTDSGLYTNEITSLRITHGGGWRSSVSGLGITPSFSNRAELNIGFRLAQSVH
jgi:hypothetical protein